LHEQIDRLIETPLAGPPAPPAADAEFIRRVYLDFAGMIPTAEQARDFLDDPSPYKRSRVLDHLLDQPEFIRRLQMFLDLWLMERRPATHVPEQEWTEFLRQSLAQSKPFPRIVREILAADGLDPATRPAARFYLDRAGEPLQITRDVGRLFLGKDMQCAQCHDHVLIDDYKQAHYHGLLAFFNRSFLATEPNGKATFGEKAEGEVTYRSVFKKKSEHQTGPRILDQEELADPPVAKGSEYVRAPGNNTHAIPAFSRRARLAEYLTSGQIPEFDRNLANRLWALLFGRGLVHPLDMHHGDNPPSHPELLELLTREIRDRKYDLREFLRELALTRAYARSSEPPPDASEDSLAPERYAVASLRPLSPEQLAWSTMQATGIVAAYRANAQADLLGRDPRLQAIVQLDQARERLGRELIEKRVHDQLTPSVQTFVRIFGKPAGQPQEGGDATVQQALFLANGGTLSGWLENKPHLLIGQLLALNDPDASADRLYLSILTRRPTADERAEFRQVLETHKDQKARALQDLAWALLTSSEFRFNH
jgi:hypothetical protein